MASQLPGSSVISACLVRSSCVVTSAYRRSSVSRSPVSSTIRASAAALSTWPTLVWILDGLAEAPSTFLVGAEHRHRQVADAFGHLLGEDLELGV